ncbi:unnamed protein product [Adineta steineri]|uniref:TRAF-type domain-containing protein n=1 Tax=Adineta steineri TaxID=433720 RepID=A0A815RKL0_9BILA|nr:unnamed protein product [Adineta steineri]CAF1478311.1 unnamed protein product [Adineta steineri]CAF1480941.1 unnamed protein product [Adineta steineri]
MEKNSITRDRVVDNDRTFKEYSCQICQNLLWKPNSCSSCHRILCEKCMQKWFENPLNRNSCPFCSKLSEYKPCSFLAQLMLSHLRIRCRNEKLGCKQILPYKQLEHHETANCQYLSEQCVRCNQLILRSKLVDHQQRSEQCISCPIKCTICKNSFEGIDFQEHFTECYQQKIDQLNTNIYCDSNMGRDIPDNEQIAPNSSLIYLEKSYDNIELVFENLSPIRLYYSFIPTHSAITLIVFIYYDLAFLIVSPDI